MAEADWPVSTIPFAPQYRSSGVLLHITSLPSPYGVGDVGPTAFAMVDRLQAADQSWWQSLPLGPTGYGNSPYQCLSSFAGSGLLISPDSLIVDGLLRPGDCQERGPFSNEAVDYDAATAFKHKLLEKAWTNFRGMAHSALRQEYDQFCIQHAHWLNDYALLRRLSLFGFGERRIFCPDLP